MKSCTLLLLLLLPGLSACGDYHWKNQVYSATAVTQPHFSSIRANILQPRCASCHEHAGGEDEGLSTYAEVRDQVRPGNAEGSKLYKEIISGDMPIGTPALNDDDILAIYQWINNGALND